MDEKNDDVAGDIDLLAYTAEIQSYVNNNYTINEIQEASRRTHFKLSAREFKMSDFDDRAANQANSRNTGKVYAMQQEENSNYPVINNDEQYINYHGIEDTVPTEKKALCAYGNKN